MDKKDLLNSVTVAKFIRDGYLRYDEVVSKAVDEYLNFIDKSKTQDELQLLLNPAWHVHNGKVPKEDIIMSFSMLLIYFG